MHKHPYALYHLGNKQVPYEKMVDLIIDPLIDLQIISWVSFPPTEEHLNLRRLYPGRPVACFLSERALEGAWGRESSAPSHAP
jgi:hypothetical protein